MMSEEKALQDAIEWERRCRFLSPDTAHLEPAVHKRLPIKSLDKVILDAANDFGIVLEEMSQSLKLPSGSIF